MSNKCCDLNRIVTSACMCGADPTAYREDRVAVPGDNAVVIQCLTSHSGPVLWQIKHYWEQNVIDVYDGENVIGRYEGRCSVDNVSHDLTIHQPAVSDTGEYWCIEEEGLGTKHKTQLYVTGILMYFA